MNFKALADNLFIDEDDYLELLVIFLERGTADLKKCRAAIAERDAELAAGAIHSFKGASGQLGLTRLHEGAIAAEKDIKNSRMEQGAQKIDPLLNEMDTLAARVGAAGFLPPD
jgi:HPt (histidine-containing phosphotransfer) domain-containing protein